MKAVHFRHTGLVVNDLDKALYIYQDIFGFKVHKKNLEQGQFIEKILKFRNARVTTVKMYLGEKSQNTSMLELLYFHDSYAKLISNSIYNIGLTHIALTVDKIDQICINLQEVGLEIISNPVLSDDRSVRVAFIKGLFSEYLELVEEQNCNESKV